MKVLVTGATGYIGRFVAEKLVALGHEVVGTARNEGRLAALPQGVRPLVADLTEPEPLIEAAREADATLNTAFVGHGTDWQTAVGHEKNLIEQLVGALSGTGKTLIVSNGTLFLGDSGDERFTEETPVVAGHPGAIRAEATRPVLDASGAGLRGIELRIASFVYGNGGSIFVPALVGHARRTGQSVYVADGSARTSVIHVEAAADAFVKALENGAAGEIYNICCDEEPSIRQVAEAVAIGTKSTVGSLSVDDASAALDPFTAWFLVTNNRLSSVKARRDLNWSPAGHVPLLWDIAHGSYA